MEALDEAVIDRLRALDSSEGHELRELALHFKMSPERLRDRLRRLVDRGVLVQSEPITGRSDANPRYSLPNR